MQIAASAVEKTRRTDMARLTVVGGYTCQQNATPFALQRLYLLSYYRWSVWLRPTEKLGIFIGTETFERNRNQAQFEHSRAREESKPLATRAVHGRYPDCNIMNSERIQSGMCRLTVRSDPSVIDSRELESILLTSLRALFGEWNQHCFKVEAECVGDGLFFVDCSSQSLGAVRSALAMNSPPPYLKSALYLFDVVAVESL